MKKSLPIFPLPLVLLPFEVLPLHIFEPRYRRMLEVVEAGDGQFGVSFFNPRTPLDDEPELGGGGTVAHITGIERLPDGRANINTVGVFRYRLIDWVQNTGEPFLTAEIEPFTDEAEDARVLQPLVAECADLYSRLIETSRVLLKSQGRATDALRGPDEDPEILSFLMTGVANLPPKLKYEMLETRSTVERLTEMRPRVQSIVANLEASAAAVSAAKSNGHGKISGKR